MRRQESLRVFLFWCQSQTIIAESNQTTAVTMQMLGYFAIFLQRNTTKQS